MAIVYFLNLPVRVQNNQASHRPCSAKLDDCCPHELERTSKEGQTTGWRSFSICVWGQGEQAAVFWQPLFLSQLAGGHQQKLGLGRPRQIAFAREGHSVAGSAECADAVWDWCCRCLRAEEKLLELEFQLARTGTVRTKRRESPGKRWQGRSIAMSCQSLCQNENGKALGQWS